MTFFSMRVCDSLFVCSCSVQTATRNDIQTHEYTPRVTVKQMKPRQETLENETTIHAEISWVSSRHRARRSCLGTLLPLWKEIKGLEFLQTCSVPPPLLPSILLLTTQMTNVSHDGAAYVEIESCRFSRSFLVPMQLHPF
jgi:hypothetical protein